VADQVGPTEFLGYETEDAEGAVTALVKNGAQVDKLAVGEEGYVIVNQTPFYGESGGQVGDTGSLKGDGIAAEVIETSKHHGVFAHKVKIIEGSIGKGQALELHVDHARRSAIRANHSATHLLHEALRLVLGDHVAQKGSLVSPDRLRFDFVHTKPITEQELAQVEDIANDIVLQNSLVETRLMGVEEAKQSGARALFGEKYGDEVRVVAMGDTPGNALGWSVELCGGTHVRRTGDIGLITVVAESAVGAGVRRVEALTGKAARHRGNTNAAIVSSAASLLRSSTHDVLDRIEALQEQLKRSERALSEAKRKLALGGGAGKEANEAETVNGMVFVGHVVEDLQPKDLRGLVDQAKKQAGSAIVAIIGVTEDGKAGLAVGVTEDLVGKVSAVDLVKVGAAALGGQGGGGRADMAQAGGPDGTKADEALAAIKAYIAAL
jgi:alanyl-tRNA synthetase